MSLIQQLIDDGKFKEAFEYLLRNYFENGHYRSNLTAETASRHMFTIVALIQNNKIKSLFIDKTSRDEIKAIVGGDSTVVGAYYQFGKWLSDKQPPNVVSSLSDNFVEGVLKKIQHRVAETSTRVTGIQTQLSQLMIQQAQLTTNMSNIGTTLDAMQNEQQEVVDTLQVVHSDVQRLTESFLFHQKETTSTIQLVQTDLAEIKNTTTSQSREMLEAMQAMHTEMKDFRTEMSQFRQDTGKGLRRLVAISKQTGGLYKHK